MKGQLNKIHRTVKECMTGAAARFGRYGKGAGGMDGFWDFVAQKSPEFLAAAVAKTCVPPAKDVEPAPSGGYVHTVNVISIPHNHQLCPDGNYRPHEESEALWREHKAKLKAKETPLLLEHSAVIEQEVVQVEPEPLEPEPEPEPVKKLEPAPKYQPLPPRIRRY
jgi:hypothetical protein